VPTFVNDLHIAPGGGDSSASGAFNAGAGNLVLITVFASNGVSLSSLSYGAQTPTLIPGSAIGDILGVYSLLSPTAGSQTVTATYSDFSPRPSIYIESWSGAHASTPVGTPAVATADSSAPSVTVTSASGQTVTGTCWIYSGADGVASGGTGQTEHENITNWVDSGVCTSAVEKAGAASVQLDWTTTSVANPTWFAVAIPIIAAADGGGSTLRNLLLLGVG
jgi:hypothetical protein